MRIKDADEPDIGAMLTADGDQTVVVWEERGMPLLDLLSAYGAGVQIQFEDLADPLAGRERRDDAKARWEALHPASQSQAAEPPLPVLAYASATGLPPRPVVTDARTCEAAASSSSMRSPL